MVSLEPARSIRANTNAESNHKKGEALCDLALFFGLVLLIESFRGFRKFPGVMIAQVPDSSPRRREDASFDSAQDARQ